MADDYSEEINPYDKRVEDLIEDAEIEAELEAEHKIRSKNTKLLMISLVGVCLVILIYLGVDMSFEENKSPVPEEPQVTQYVAQPKPIPFMVNPPELTKSSSRTTHKTVDASPQKNIFEPPQEPMTLEESTPSTKNKIEGEKTGNNAETISKQTAKLVKVKKIATKAKVKAVVKKVAVKRKHKPVSKNTSKPTITQKPNESEPQKGYVVQVGVFSLKTNAEKLVTTLQAKGLSPVIQPRSTQQMMNVVFVGDYKNEENTQVPLEELKQAGFKPALKKNGDNSYTLILGKFKTNDQANTLRDELSLKGFLSDMKKSNVVSTNYVVQLGAFQTKEEALSTQETMEQLGYRKVFIKTVG